MRKPTRWDYLGAGLLWTTASFLLGWGLDVAGAPDEGVVIAALGTWALGLAGARIWWLRRGGESPGTARPDGLTTGEMTAQRLAEMEARIYELEERLDLTERLLAEARERPRIARSREDTPV